MPAAPTASATTIRTPSVPSPMWPSISCGPDVPDAYQSRVTSARASAPASACSEMCSKCGRPITPIATAQAARTTSGTVIEPRRLVDVCWVSASARDSAGEHQEVQPRHVERGAQRGDQQHGPQQLAVAARPARRRATRERAGEDLVLGEEARRTATKPAIARQQTRNMPCVQRQLLAQAAHRRDVASSLLHRVHDRAGARGTGRP